MSDITDPQVAFLNIWKATLLNYLVVKKKKRNSVLCGQTEVIQKKRAVYGTRNFWKLK